MNIDLTTTAEVHGINKCLLGNICIDGERVRWGRYGYRHSATAFGITECGGTRHSALNALLKALHTRKNDMPASKDRVKFRIMASMFSGNPHSLVSLLSNTLGIDYAACSALHEQAKTFGYVEIICRPSQFARFLIHRNRLGFPNGFKELEAELFVPEPPKLVQKPMDVSRNPA